jgi:hypothetical protein
MDQRSAWARTSIPLIPNPDGVFARHNTAFPLIWEEFAEFGGNLRNREKA